MIDDTPFEEFGGVLVRSRLMIRSDHLISCVKKTVLPSSHSPARERMTQSDVHKDKGRCARAGRLERVGIPKDYSDNEPSRRFHIAYVYPSHIEARHEVTP